MRPAAELRRPISRTNFALGGFVRAELEATASACAAVAVGADLAASAALSHQRVQLWAARHAVGVRQLYFAATNAGRVCTTRAWRACVGTTPVIGYVSVVLLPRLSRTLDASRSTTGRRSNCCLSYSANAYPFSKRYQNCTSGMEMPGTVARCRWTAPKLAARAQQWLQAQGYAHGCSMSERV